MDLTEMGVESKNYAGWSRLRRAFSISVAVRTDYIESQYKPEFAAAVNACLAEFVRSHNGADLPQAEIDDYAANIPDEQVWHHVSIQLNAARKRVLGL